jgi:diketogulonate reductase-like aldo/keto reductase
MKAFEVSLKKLGLEYLDLYLIRWLQQKNIVPLPKSTHEKYIMENADVFDFSISEEDMTAIDRIPYCGGMMFDPDSARS